MGAKVINPFLIKTKEEIISAQAKSARFRSKCTWYNEGEKA